MLLEAAYYRLRYKGSLLLGIRLRYLNSPKRIFLTSSTGGRLGHGDEAHRLVPTLIGGLGNVKVVAVGCSSVHSAFVTHDGSMLHFRD